MEVKPFFKKEAFVMEHIEKPDVQFVLEGDLRHYRQAILSRCPAREYPAGHLFQLMGLPNEPLYYLVAGTVEIYTTNSLGYARLIGIHRADTLFNLDRFGGEGLGAVITSRAAGPVTAATVTMEDLSALAAKLPGLWPDLAAYLGRTLRLMCYDAKEQTIHDVATRLIHFLLLYTEGMPAAVIPISHQRLASAIGASRVQVTRTLADLRQRGLVHLSRGRIEILDRTGLSDYCAARDPSIGSDG